MTQPNNLPPPVPGGPTATGGDTSRKGDPCDEGLVRLGGEVPGYATGRSQGSAEL